MDNKQSITFRLTPEAIEIIKAWAKNLGVSQAAIVEMSAREFNQKRSADIAATKTKKEAKDEEI